MIYRTTDVASSSSRCASHCRTSRGSIEMTGDAMRAPADGKCEAAEIGHDGEHRFIGDIVADENRTAALERFVGHQFEDARSPC